MMLKTVEISGAINAFYSTLYIKIGPKRKETLFGFHSLNGSYVLVKGIQFNFQPNISFDDLVFSVDLKRRSNVETKHLIIVV